MGGLNRHWMSAVSPGSTKSTCVAEVIRGAETRPLASTWQLKVTEPEIFRSVRMLGYSPGGE